HRQLLPPRRFCSPGSGVVVGLAVAACPCCFIVHVWTSLERQESEVLCERVDVRRAEPVSCIETTVGVAIKGAERRWKWRCNDTSQLKYAWVLLLDVRLLWYAVMDSALLVVVAIAAVVGGLNGSGDVDSCRGWSIAVIVLMCLQLLVLLFCQPFTSIFAYTHAALTLALTGLSTAFQLAFLYEAPDTRTSQRRLIESSAVCGLLVVGVSALKALVDLRDVAAACRRRFAMLQTLRTTQLRTAVRAVNLLNEMPSEAEIRKIDVTLIDAVLLDHQSTTLLLDDVRDDGIPLSDSLIGIEEDMQFWDNAGRALAQDVDNHATQMHFLEAEASALLIAV
ncbi:membrane-associated protein, putative, partial [Bodo saltans]